MRFRGQQGRWKVLGTGAALPGPAIGTREALERIEQHFGVSVLRKGLKIAAQIGVETRHFCRDFELVGEGPRTGDSNPELAARAVEAAAHEAGVKVNDLGYIIAHTTSPRTLLPSNMAWMADILGYSGPYVELRQACAGFAHAVMLGTGLVRERGDAPIAIVGSETGSVFLDPGQAEIDTGQLINLVQMGDGAGAVILGPDDGDAGEGACTIGNPYVGSLGPGLAPGFWMSGGGSEAPASTGVLHFHHDFAGVRSHGAALFAASISAAMGNGVDLGMIDRFLPHQANAVELPAMLAGSLGVDASRVIVDCDRVGNLGSASIWVALDRVRKMGMRNNERMLILGAEATKYLFGGFVYQHGRVSEPTC